MNWKYVSFRRSHRGNARGVANASCDVWEWGGGKGERVYKGARVGKTVHGVARLNYDPALLYVLVPVSTNGIHVLYE